MRKFKFRFIPCMIAILLIFQISFSNSNRENRFKAVFKNIFADTYCSLISEFNLPFQSLKINLKPRLKNTVKSVPVLTLCSAVNSSCNITSELPDAFRYRDINEDALKAYLSYKSSILKEEPYFSSIINVGRSFDINPVLLFAITGQEQGFVPQYEVSAALIANNPYNVFYSWQNYNTNIIDSSEIACRTIINLSKNRPVSVDPLVWINQKYSSDQNWHCGVRNLYNEIASFISEYEKSHS